MRSARWKLQSPSGVGAVAVIGVFASDESDLDAALGVLGLAPLPSGKIGVRQILGVDEGVVARWSETSAAIMPHGGGAVVRALCEALKAHGVQEAERVDPRAAYPEASSGMEAAMLAALAAAASPLAVDLLLDQPRRWGLHPNDADDGRDRILKRLIEPPLVVAVGASNIGKSTLANALAGRHVSLVADEPGTTRDHVGVMLNLAGLVVRYVDTPGMREGAPDVEVEAVRLVRELLARADLILLCTDGSTRLVAPTGARPGAKVLRVGLRSDLGPPSERVDLAVSVRRGESIAELVRASREQLVPAAVLAAPGPWRFWNEGEVEGV
ncbi:MAG: 50S ribosome-binding GTPase [Phycisphaerae bacterium]|nr:50S ribosome-binding GTPase [Phycisphaerae bacterium]